MIRHLVLVLFSAMIGSTVGTLIMEAIFRESGEPSPIRAVVAIGTATLIFSVPGSILLMALMFALADRKIRVPEMRLTLMFVGILIGAAILGLGARSLSSAFLGALYGGLTAIAFVSLLSLFRAYPDVTT